MSMLRLIMKKYYDNLRDFLKFQYNYKLKKFMWN